MIVLDVKFPDPDRFRQYTGGDLEKTLAFARYCTETKKRLWLRTVVVPGVNDTEADMAQYAALVRELRFERYELLGFHTMGFFKYEKLNLVNPLADVGALPPERLGELQRALDALLGFNADEER